MRTWAIGLRERALRMLVVLFLCVTAAPRMAQAVTLTFDELPFQPVDDLSFMGVTFDFKVGGFDSLDANYNSGGPGSITYVQDPSLEGDATGILALDFTTPTPQLDFGAALSTGSTLTPGFSVELFDASLVSLGVTPVNTSSLVFFSEGLFSYSGVPVRRAVIDFDGSSANRFALDNLTYGGTVIPEPTSFLLLGLGGLGAGLARRRKQT